MEFRVSGLRSRRCVRALSAGISDVAGVRTVEVDLSSGTVRVSGDADPAAVRAAVTALGIAVEP
ncbi:heavy-metal-associated domain-containing protein [Virgisporangium ochraceum]|uniref:heavy-metal-associated domain-containing protein n=1 Tax=Virgisporangium ochraceum TaxID=65505 RepID=UPI001942D6E7|nr:heavy-metal-associated domain-containing protein [Virgisporangium ochraceum]